VPVRPMTFEEIQQAQGVTPGEMSLTAAEGGSQYSMAAEDEDKTFWEKLVENAKYAFSTQEERDEIDKRKSDMRLWEEQQRQNYLSRVKQHLGKAWEGSGGWEKNWKKTMRQRGMNEKDLIELANKEFDLDQEIRFAKKDNDKKKVAELEAQRADLLPGATPIRNLPPRDPRTGAGGPDDWRSQPASGKGTHGTSTGGLSKQAASQFGIGGESAALQGYSEQKSKSQEEEDRKRLKKYISF